jgi:hypothetical protein
MKTSLFIKAGGKVSGVYCDWLDVRKLGAFKIERAGSVEPDAMGSWEVKIEDAVLGSFVKREVAIQAEVNEVTRRLRA